MTSRPWNIGLGLALLMNAGSGVLQLARSQPPASPSLVDSTTDAGEADADQPRRRLVKWNEYDGPVSTLRFGFGFLVDAVEWRWRPDYNPPPPEGEVRKLNGLRSFTGWAEYPDCQRHYLAWPKTLAP